MESLPQVAAAIQQVLTEVADQAAREVGFIRRQRVLTGAVFVQALVLGWLARPEATLHQLTQSLAVRGAAISPQGLAQRFTREAAKLMERVLAAAIATVVTRAGTPAGLLARCPGVFVLDCTTIRLPDPLAEVWRGGGGRVAPGTASALKLQVRLDLVGGRLEGLAPLAGRTQDKAGSLHTAPLPDGALLLQDLGFWSLTRLRAVGEQGACGLSRLDPQTHVLSADGVRLDLPRWLAKPKTPTVAAEVRRGVRARLPARLLAARVPTAVANERRRKLRAAAKREGKQPPKATLALADWTVYVTNVPAERLSVAEALVLGRARWQIELLFKLWKQEGRLDESRSADPWRVLTEVYAKLVARLIQHWVFLIGGWAYPDRSLVQAAQTVREHAICLLQALGRPAALINALRTIRRGLAAGCHIASRKTKPSAFQLLRDPALGGVAALS